MYYSSWDKTGAFRPPPRPRRYLPLRGLGMRCTIDVAESRRAAATVLKRPVIALRPLSEVFEFCFAKIFPPDRIGEFPH